MLENVDLSIELSKEEYKTRWPKLRNRLYDLQKACWDAGIPSMIVFEGWDAAGKGTTINKLSQRLDPRGFKLYPIQAPRTGELHMPWLWRFWLKVPNYGQMAIFDRSWYGRVLVERVEKLTPTEQWRQAYQDIVNFEHELVEDGYIMIKFFFHISKKEQKERFKKLEKDPLTSWHVQPEDWEHHKKYDDYKLAVEEMLEQTDTEWGPWTIVEATDFRWSRVKVLDTLVSRLEEALAEKGKQVLPTGQLTDLILDAAKDADAKEYIQQDTIEAEAENVVDQPDRHPEDEASLEADEAPQTADEPIQDVKTEKEG